MERVSGLYRVCSRLFDVRLGDELPIPEAHLSFVAWLLLLLVRIVVTFDGGDGWCETFDSNLPMKRSRNKSC